MNGVNDTCENLLPVSLIPVNRYSAVSMTPAINFRLFGYFWSVLMSPGKNVIAGVNDTGDKLLWRQRSRGRMLPPWKSASIASSHTLTIGTWGRQNWFKPNFFYTYSHWQKKAFSVVMRSNLARPDSTCKEKQSLLLTTVCKEKNYLGHIEFFCFYLRRV
jgi:hypothetical protein